MMMNVVALVGLAFSALCAAAPAESTKDANINITIELPVLSKPLQCEKASYGFCCEFGVPCDCSKGVTSPGQCTQDSYAFCCSIGKVCDCSQPPLETSVENTPAELVALIASGPVGSSGGDIQNLVSSATPSLSTEKPLQCKKASYGFCCEVGVPCDCTKGVTAPGQCAQASYAFCCSIGADCDCSQPPLSLGEPLRLAAPIDSDSASVETAGGDAVAFVHPASVEVGIEKPLQCKKASYAFCCEVGVPCDCTKGVIAPGQCKAASYVFCCNIGAQCDCTLPPVEDIAGILV